MDTNKILTFIEDKNINISDNWYFHATSNDIEVVKKIFDEGIKCAYLRDAKPGAFNGNFYISLYKYSSLDDGLNLWLDKYPKFVIDNISPLYADRKKYVFRKLFINTKIPLRTSKWDYEYQEYLMIDRSNFVAMGYDLSYIFRDMYCSDGLILDKLQKQKLLLLREIIEYMYNTDNCLPIYDFSSKKEINKEKVLSLHI